MNPDTWRIHDVTPDLVGQTVLVEVTPGEILQARITRVQDHTLTVEAHAAQHDVDLSAGKRVWVRVA